MEGTSTVSFKDSQFHQKEVFSPLKHLCLTVFGFGRRFLKSRSRAEQQRKYFCSSETVADLLVVNFLFVFA